MSEAPQSPPLTSPPGVTPSGSQTFELAAKVQKCGLLNKRPFTTTSVKWQKR